MKSLWKSLPRFPSKAESEVWEGIDELTTIPEVKSNPLFKAFLARQKELKQATVKTEEQKK
jgi:hypothetical protein